VIHEKNLQKKILCHSPSKLPLTDDVNAALLLNDNAHLCMVTFCYLPILWVAKKYTRVDVG